MLLTKHVLSENNLGLEILSEIDSMSFSHALFDDAGRIIYGSNSFFEMFKNVLQHESIFNFLHKSFLSNDFSMKFDIESIDNIFIGLFEMKNCDHKEVFYAVIPQSIDCEKTIFECVFFKTMPQIVIYYTVRNILSNSIENVANAIASFSMESELFERKAHLLRTSRHMYCLCMALKEMCLYDLTEEDVNSASACSMLHDIGNRYIPRYILQKTERLSEFEWNVIKGHVAAGLNVAEALRFPRMAVDMIAYHHCRWDGVQDRWNVARQAREAVRGGYPFVAEGSDIPVWARAFAYVDIFDALVTPRSYRQAWSPRKAADYIRDELVGTHLDPGMYPAFVESLACETCRGA